VSTTSSRQSVSKRHGLRKEHIDAFRDMGWSDEKIKLTVRLILEKTAKP
jgi:glutamyl/glutaminyl-tRNA synthetase